MLVLYMISTIPRHLGVIDGTSTDWESDVRQQIDGGSNFLLVLENKPDSISKFCNVFEMEPDCNPTPLPRYSLFSMSQYIDTRHFDELLQAQNDGKRIVFIDQLDLALNKPPRVKPYLVYCPIWGIISQHEELRQAKESIEEYAQTLYRFRPNPDAAIYRWVGGKWEILEIP
jgi:hypothetical protein